jgi:Peptidase family M28
MKHLVLVAFLFSTSSLSAQKKPLVEIDKLITRNEAEAHLTFLSADEMRGRDTGSREIDIAANYIASVMKQLGIKPVPGADNYFQPVHLEKVVPATSASLKIDTALFKLRDNLVVVKGSDVNWSGDLIYVGYGSKDEMTGDVKGKWVVALAGARDMTNPMNIFSVSSEKAERAARLGASGLVEILVTPPFPWPGLVNYFSGNTRFGLKNENEIPVVWLKEMDAPVIQKLKEQKIATGTIQISGTRKTAIVAKNVLGMVEGSDPQLKNEYVVISAHYDHVGVGKVKAGEDSIFNGARDNAIGTVGMLETARFLANFPPKRSVVFMALTAEEKGLLGSAWYAEHPLIPLHQTVFNFNCDGAGYNDKTLATVIGLERTTAEADLTKACAAFGLTATKDPAPEQNLFERSDNFNFAKKGIPAIDFAPGVKAFDQELMKYYHQPGDEFASLDMEYLLRYFKAYVYANFLIANGANTPMWKAGDKFEMAAKELYRNK